MKKIPKSGIFKAAIIAAALGAGAALMLSFQQTQDPDAEKQVSERSSSGKDPVLIQPLPGWWESRRSIYYGIPARIKFHLPGGGRPEAEEIAEKAWSEFRRIGDIFSPSDPESETSRLNAADKTSPVKVSEDMFEVLTVCRRLWEVSGGAFDPTTTQIKQVWQDAVRTQEIPSRRDIKKVMSKTGFGKVDLGGDKKTVVCSAKGIKFDFGGIAKGFAVDRVTGLLKNTGIKDGLVQLGGEISAFGKNHGEKPWRIGIQHPENMQDIWATVSARRTIRVSSSGNYRQPLRIQGHEFYHIFSPETGKPVSGRVLGVTTAALPGQTDKNISSAMLDGAATAIAAAGEKRGMKIAERLKVECLILTRDGKSGINQQVSPAMEKALENETPRDY